MASDGREHGIRGLTGNIVRGQVELTSDNARVINRCAEIAFKGQWKGSLRDSITLITHGFAIMFNPDEDFHLDEEAVEHLIKLTESDNIFEALAKTAKKELNGKNKH